MTNDPARRLEEIAGSFFSFLERSFPVCSASDEFYFFPQIGLGGSNRAAWDDFSPETIREFAEKSRSWEAGLDRFSPGLTDPEAAVELDLLKRALSTLREELTEVRSHLTQPSFHLTVITAGLAEALEKSDQELWKRRVEDMPAFLDMSRRNLQSVPELFRELGLEMIPGCRRWLGKLNEKRGGLTSCLEALDRFEQDLRSLAGPSDFRPGKGLFDRIVRRHLGWGKGLKEAREEIEDEIHLAEENLKKEAANLLPGADWPKALSAIAIPELPPGGFLDLFREEIEKLAAHCAKLGVIAPDAGRGASPRVAPVPPYLSAVRTASSYSIPPGHPAGSGTFYVISMESDRPAPDYRMLTAHETYPGHHLLDTSRWNLPRPLRRHFESPLFYEGWACFGEELMARTGYFEGPADRFLLARRRLWRALRGKMDLGLQTGEMNIEDAAGLLSRAGLDRKRALSAARRYALRPGYQMCYTLGLKRFLGLYSRYGADDPARFARIVLSGGEIPFEALERIFNSQNQQGKEE